MDGGRDGPERMDGGRDGPGRLAGRLGALREYVATNRRTVAVDLAVLTAWALLLVAIVVLGRLPRAILYVGLLAGVVSYSLVARWRDDGWPR